MLNALQKAFNRIVEKQTNTANSRMQSECRVEQSEQHHVPQILKGGEQGWRRPQMRARTIPFVGYCAAQAGQCRRTRRTSMRRVALWSEVAAAECSDSTRAMKGLRRKRFLSAAFFAAVPILGLEWRKLAFWKKNQNLICVEFTSFVKSAVDTHICIADQWVLVFGDWATIATQCSGEPWSETTWSKWSCQKYCSILERRSQQAQKLSQCLLCYTAWQKWTATFLGSPLVTAIPLQRGFHQQLFHSC